MATPITIGAAAGEYMEAVLVTEWRARPGDRVRAGDVVAVVETAKAATEVEAPCDGVLGRIAAGEGGEVAIDTPLGFILAEGEDEGEAETAGEPEYAAASDPAPETRQATPMPAPARQPGGRVVASPVARRLARAAGLDLSHLAGSGPRGRIKRRDVEAALAAAPGVDAALPVVLLHGFAADAAIWSALAAELGRDRALLRPELPGHGKAPPPPGAGFNGLVAPMLEWLDAQQAARLHLVGHSLGGAVALALAGQRPGRIASLTLIAPAGLGPGIDGEALAGICRATHPESLLPWLRRLVADPGLIGDDYARAAMAGRGAALRAAQTALAGRLFPDGTQGFDLRPVLAGVDVPLRLIWGREDAILPWRQALAAPGHAGLHLLPGTGHMPHVEAPQLVARILREVLAAAQSGGGDRA